MKRTALFIFLFCMIFLSTAFAHPPSDIIITYNPQTKILQAVIMHNVGNPESHYIKTVDVSLNGKEIINHTLSRQDNTVSQTVSYLIPDAKESDKLAVEAHCSISGKLEKEITVGAAGEKK